jgi:hypothetical protein
MKIHEIPDVELQVNPGRRADPGTGAYDTGIYVRAWDAGRAVSVDISRLDAPSLLKWLRSRGGKNEWAENVCGILLGYPNLIELVEKHVAQDRVG